MKTKINTRTSALPKMRYRQRWQQLHQSSTSIGFYAPVLMIFILTAWTCSFLLGFQTVLTLLNISGLLLAAVGIWNPKPGLIGISFLCTLDALTRTFLLSGGLWRWNTLNYWLLVVIILNLPLFLRIQDVHTRLVQVLLAIMGLMLFFSLNLKNGVQTILNILTMFGILIYFIRAIKDKSTWYWAGLICGFTSAVGGAVFYLQIGELPYINPNSFIHFPLAGIFALCLGLPEAIKKEQGRFLILVLMIVNLVWVFLSGSRGGLLTAFMCVIYYVIVMRSFSWTSALLILGLISFFWFSNFLLDKQIYSINRIQKLFDSSYTLAQRTSGRSDIFWTGWQIFLEQPLGIGTGSFEEGANYLDIIGGKNRPAHSAWIKVLAENGFLGFIVFFLWVFSYFIRGASSGSYTKFSIGLLVTLVLSFAFVTTEFSGKNLWFLTAGATAMLSSDQLHQLFIQSPYLFNGLKKRNKRRRILTNGQPKA